jgi:hypothetical protein
MKKAIIIRHTGVGEVVDLGSTSEESYKTMSEAVGGLIEAVDLSETLTMWCNEEGKVYGLPHNALATKVFMRTFGHIDMIKGDVIITGGSDDEGDTLGLTDEQLAAWLFIASV